MKFSTLTLLALLLALPTYLVAQDEQPAENAHEHAEATEHADVPKDAVAVLASTSGSEVKGIIRMRQEDGYVHITGKVINLTPGKHGFHIHEFGDLTKADGTAAGGHYDPHGHDHGAPGEDSHMGDLGNIEANEEGIANIDMKAEGVVLHLVLGRSLVVHADEDDLTSQPSGNAGPRIGVGVIGIAQPKE